MGSIMGKVADSSLHTHAEAHMEDRSANFQSFYCLKDFPRKVGGNSLSALNWLMRLKLESDPAQPLQILLFVGLPIVPVALVLLGSGQGGVRPGLSPLSELDKTINT